MTVKAEIVAFTSSDIDLDRYTPADRRNAGGLVRILAGPPGSGGEESFDVVVGTPAWVEANGEVPPLLVVDEWDWPAIETRLRAKVAEAEGPDWNSVANQIDQWALWEFRDYRPFEG